MKKLKIKTQKHPWFKNIRRSYLPISLEGLAIYLAYVLYEVILLIYWYHQGHDYGHLLTTIIPLEVGAAVLTQFIAARNSN